MSAYVDTGMNLIDVEDVAKDTSWPSSGQRGERYILATSPTSRASSSRSWPAIAAASRLVRMPHLLARLAHATLS